MTREEAQRRRLRDIASRMKTTDQALRRDTRHGHGPVLDAWKAIHARVDEAFMPPSEDEV